MIQIDPYSYMRKNMDYYSNDFYKSPQFGSVTSKMLDLFFNPEGYFHTESKSFPREKYVFKVPSKQKMVVDFFSPDGDFFKQLLLHHQSQYYTQTIGMAQQQKNTFFSVIEAKSVYWQSLLGSFIDKLAQCQNYAVFTVIHSEYYRNPSNLYLILIEKYLNSAILNEVTKQTFGQGNYTTNIVLSSARSLNKAHVVIQIRTLAEYIRAKILINAHVNVQKIDYTTCICDQIQNTELQRKLYMDLDGTQGPGTKSDNIAVPTCHIQSIRSMGLLVTQLILKNIEQDDPLRDLAAFYLLISAYISRHIKKTIVLYNLLVAINMCGDSLILMANQTILNSLVQRLLEHTKSQYTINRSGGNGLIKITNFQDITQLQMINNLEKHAINNTLILLVSEQVHTFLNSRYKFVQISYKKGYTPFLNQNVEGFSNYTQILRIILKNNKIADIEHMKLKQNLDIVVNSYQTLQSAVLSLITKSMDYEQNYILALNTEIMIQQLLNNCDYVIKDIVAAIYDEDKAAKLGDKYHKKQQHSIILFNVIETTYERLNELFGVKTKQEMIDQQLQTIKYYENLEKSGIDIKLKEWKHESEDMFVLKQILKSKQFIKMIGYGILFIYIFKHLLVWLMH